MGGVKGRGPKKRTSKVFWHKAFELYAKGIHDLPRRWAEVMKTNGEYIIDEWYLVGFFRRKSRKVG